MTKWTANTRTSAANRKIDMKRGATFLRMISLALALGFAMTACHPKRLTNANVAEISEGMTKKQVESILGPPTAIDTKDFVLLKTTTYNYRQINGTVTIVFKEDKVQSKASTLSE